MSDNMTKSGKVSGNSVKVKCIHGHLDKKISELWGGAGGAQQGAHGRVGVGGGDGDRAHGDRKQSM
jgi:hypothetical protein